MTNPAPKPNPLQPARRPYAALPLLWAVVVLVLTLTPSDEMPRTPAWELLSFDTAAHAGVFFVLAGLSWFSLHRQRRWPWLARHAGWAVLVGSVLFGALIEVLQMTMKLGRHGEWSDLLSDSIGAALAIGIATVWAKRYGRKLHPLIVTTALLLVAGATQAQDIARARHAIEKLASPKMHGRGYVLQGEHIAAAYLRKRLKELKLEPLMPDYTQPFTLDVNTFPREVTAELHSAIHTSVPLQVGFEKRLSIGQDFIIAPTSGGVIHSTDFTCIRYDSIFIATPPFVADNAVDNKCLVLTQQQAHALNTGTTNSVWLAAFGAVMTIVPKLTASVADSQTKQVRLEVLASSVQPLLPSAPIAERDVHQAVLGPQLRLQLDAQLQRNYQTQNLAAIIRGTAQPDSFLVVSAHYDHLGMMGKDVYFPGANDNASGVALLLELAAHYAKPENRPSYSVVFLLFGAEEAGLVGSQYFVAHPLVPLKSIKFLVNLDLLGTGEQGATVVNGRVFEAPYRRLVALNDAHHYLPALGARGRAANSDHYPFSEAGVPAFFLYTRGGSTAYHDVNDKPAALSLAGFAGAFGLVRDFLNEEGAAPK
jgi:VanZ family protein